MKILSILGSPRKNGTSSRIAQAFTDAVKGFGADVDHYCLNDLTFKGCQACNTCHTKSDHCILKDDLTPVLDAMRTADVVVFSTPVYYGDVSGQFKMFFDRTCSHFDIDYGKESPYASRLPQGKTAVFILTQGAIAENHEDVVERYKFFCDLYDFDTKIIRATELSAEPNADVSNAQAEAIKLAETLMPNEAH